MLDINKMIAVEHLPACEAGEILNDMDVWTEAQARERARDEGLELTEAHLDVLCWLRDLYADCGAPRNARVLSQAMEENFHEEGGRKYLFKLFPHGPILQGCRLAGLAAPAGTTDKSFGSVH
ncbi:MAG: TusE/DsrC/DsvC family sulfur relay protein [Pseudomonadota bacterium]